MSSPNLLLIMTDQQKATSLGLYGNLDVRTPYLEQIAAEGVCFTQAYTPQPLCAPARASLWTGLWPHQHGARNGITLLDPSLDHYLARLDAAGYTLGLIGKNHCFQPADLGRFDVLSEAGHSGPVDDGGDLAVAAAKQFLGGPRLRRPRTLGRRNPHRPDVCTTGVLARRGAEFVTAQRGTGRPWALWLSFPDPHPPFQAPEPYFSRFDPERIAMPPWDPDLLATKPERLRVVHTLMRFGDYAEADRRRAVAAYYAMIAFVDDGIGQVLAALEASSQERDTVVVFTSDHGDYAGQWGMVEKWGSFAESLTRVPLLLRYPGGVPAGQRCDALASTLDVLPTFFALAGLEGPPGAGGQPLPSPYVPAGAPPRDAVFSEWGAGGPLVSLREAEAYDDPRHLGAWSALAPERAAQGRAKMIRMGRWKYCWDPMDPDGEGRELYDVAADPWEMENLAHAPEHAATCAALEQRLLRWSVLTEAPVKPAAG